MMLTINDAFKWKPAFLLLIFSLGGCGAAQESGSEMSGECARAAVNDAYCRVSMISLIAHPERYAGYDVSVSGFLATGVAPRALYLSREAWLSGDAASSITVAAADDRVAQIMENSEATFVVLSGSVHSQSVQGATGGRLRLDVDRVGVLFSASEVDLAERKMIEGFKGR